jgi:hypothetical protein
MALIGFILGLLERIFAGSKAGIGGRAIFIAFVVYFLNGIGSSAEIAFGAILQNLLCSCFLLWWAADKQAFRVHRFRMTTGHPHGEYLPQRILDVGPAVVRK